MTLKALSNREMSAPPKTVDLLSQLQSEMHRLSELFLSTIGELQRDALPCSVNEEDLVRNTSTSYDAEARSKGFATEIMQVKVQGEGLKGLAV